MVKDMPRDDRLDSTLRLLFDPYGYISKQCRRLGADAFEARILLRPTVCMTGPDAARLFYDPERFQRAGAAPAPVRATLFGNGGVQTLDGVAHLERKRMFMELMTEQRISALVELTRAQWLEAASRWSERDDEIVLYDELHRVLTRAACEWACVPLTRGEAAHRTRDLVLLFDAAGARGLRHLAARRARKSAERWLAELVVRARAREAEAATDAAFGAVCWHRERGELLSPRIAAVELLNVLRPIVAVSVYAVFVAHALHDHHEWRARLESGTNGDDERFANEVRRFYPFFPAVAALTRLDFEWQGYRFAAGRRVLLDLYGTNHDPRSWELPDEFRPDRFRDSNGDLYKLVPQGGGDALTGHRCAGERITVELMKLAVELLVRRLKYEIPPQDLAVDARRLPALPRSRMVLRRIQLDA